MKVYIVWYRGYLDSDDAWSIEKIFRTRERATDYMEVVRLRDGEHYRYRIDTEEVTDE
jgi:hypothetical protein